MANEIVAYVNEPCIMGRVAKKPGTARDDCTVVNNATGQAIASCDDTGGAGECWRLEAVADGACAGVAVEVQGDSAGTQVGQDTTVDCQLCAPGVADPARGCP